MAPAEHVAAEQGCVQPDRYSGRQQGGVAWASRRCALVSHGKTNMNMKDAWLACVANTCMSCYALHVHVASDVQVAAVLLHGPYHFKTPLDGDPNSTPL
jgi:hypothetical protein